MIDHFYHMNFNKQRGLQEQLKESLVSAILGGFFATNEPLPSCRKLSKQLSVSRNTVNLVYESLLDNGYLVSRPRSGYFLHPRYAREGGFYADLQSLPSLSTSGEKDVSEAAIDWSARFKLRPSSKHGVVRPIDWQRFAYPFIHGQPGGDLFPLDHWREASRNILRRDNKQEWLCDRLDRDDEMLIEQLRTRVLPKRGIWARSSEVLITMGSQNALYLIAVMLMNETTRVAVENPGYRDALNIFQLHGASMQLQPLDAHGMTLDENLTACDYIYLTPSHQVPTGITMSGQRRAELMERAKQRDQIIIEDDYDAELNLDNQAVPALKANDYSGRVIYTGSFSKSFSPGLRIGYLVADTDLVDELRALRRLMYRHPPLNNQRMLAEFLAQGYYDVHLRRFREQHARRRDLLHDAINSDLGYCRQIGSPGANAFWLEAPNCVDTRKLAWAAAKKGVLIEYGEQFFFDQQTQQNNCMRLGLHAIEIERIVPGIRLLSRVLEDNHAFH